MKIISSEYAPPGGLLFVRPDEFQRIKAAAEDAEKSSYEQVQHLVAPKLVVADQHVPPGRIVYVQRGSAYQQALDQKVANMIGAFGWSDVP